MKLIIILLSLFIVGEAFGYCYRPTRPIRTMLDDDFSRDMYRMSMDSYNRRMDDYLACKDREQERLNRKIEQRLDNLNRQDSFLYMY